MLDYNTVILLAGFMLFGGIAQHIDKTRLLGVIAFLIGIFGLMGTIMDPTVIMGYLNDSGTAVAITQEISELRIILILLIIFNLASFIYNMMGD